MHTIFFQFSNLEFYGGCEKYFITTTKLLNKNNIHTKIITFDHYISFILYKFVALLSLNIKLFLSIKQSDFLRVEKKTILSKLEDTEYIKVKNPFKLIHYFKKQDVIYSKNEIIELLVLNLLSIFTKLPPIVVGIHTPIIYPYTLTLKDKLHNLVYSSFIYKNLLKIAKSGKAVTDIEVDFLINKVGIKNVKKIYHPYGKDFINNKEIKPNKLTKTLNIVFVGRFYEQKGIDILTEIIEILLKKDLDIKVKILGNGDKQYEDKIINLSNNSEKLEYLGFIEDTEPYYQWADVCLITSRYETAINVAIEAIFNGNIIISTNIPGPNDLIKNNISGFLVDLDAKLFVEKVVYLLNLKKNNYEAFNLMSKKAMEIGVDIFDYESNLIELISLIKNTVD